MAFDWQTILVLIIVSLATVWVLRRVLQRLLSVAGRGKSGCESGCGKCGTTTANSAPTNFASSNQFKR